MVMSLWPRFLAHFVLVSDFANVACRRETGRTAVRVLDRQTDTSLPVA